MHHDFVGCSASSWPSATGTASAATASAAARHTPPVQPPTAHASCSWPTAHATSACTFGSHEPPIRANLGWGSLPSNASGAHQAGGWGRGRGYPAWPSADAAGALATAQVVVTCAWWADACTASPASTAGGHAASTRYASDWTFGLICWNVYNHKPQLWFWRESLVHNLCNPWVCVATVWQREGQLPGWVCMSGT